MSVETRFHLRRLCHGTPMGPRERNVDIEKWEEEGQLSLSLSLVAPTRDRHCVPHPVKILNSVEPGDNEVVSVQ